MSTSVHLKKEGSMNPMKSYYEAPKSTWGQGVIQGIALGFTAAFLLMRWLA